MLWLKLTIIVAALLDMAIFVGHFFQLGKFYRPKPQVWPRDDQKRGIIYALSQGLLPWEKESTRHHWLIYFAGIIYHASILSGFFWLIGILISISLSSILRVCLAIILSLGIISGFSLLFRRFFTSSLRQLSFPDDYAANFLVDVFLISGAISLVKREAEIFFLLISLLLILYMPVGKIRHCLFFIPSRIIFGRYFGQRGVLPPRLKLKKRIRLIVSS